MTTSRMKRRLGVVVATVVAGTLLAPAAHAAATPDAITVPDANKQFLAAHAIGVQTYSCSNNGDAGYAWQFTAPFAKLYDTRAKQIGWHYGGTFGPTWEAMDGSSVVGSRVAGATVDPTAIAWLLVRAISTTAGPTGGTRMVQTTYVQRINTTGGLAPDRALCTAATWESHIDVPYTADYLFYKKTGK